MISCYKVEKEYSSINEVKKENKIKQTKYKRAKT